MILYEDSEIIVCRKKAGLPVQSAKIGVMDLESMLKNEMAAKGSHSKEPYLGVVHRLDQPVEGIVVFAKNKKSAAALSAQIAEGNMTKQYLAVCCERRNQNPAGQTAEIMLVHYLKKQPKENRAIVVENTKKNLSDPGVKEARLYYRILDTKEREGRTYHLTQIRLLTGRFHQIRAQMAAVSMPLYGDRKYHKEWEKYEIKEGEKKASLALCAQSLTFYHPKTGKKMVFETQPENEIFQIFVRQE